MWHAILLGIVSFFHRYIDWTKLVLMDCFALGASCFAFAYVCCLLSCTQANAWPPVRWAGWPPPHASMACRLGRPRRMVRPAGSRRTSTAGGEATPAARHAFMAACAARMASPAGGGAAPHSRQPARSGRRPQNHSWRRGHAPVHGSPRGQESVCPLPAARRRPRSRRAAWPATSPRLPGRRRGRPFHYHQNGACS